ncbi:hypothetical protein [uncultured Gimesia sp.]|uniref:hypothetical protein n=1 Tax=uncultured Gimesia sp. TaxID=1678688 RepID=UPI0026293DE3|nr:hypothetical protein [uncultured Gimesia sp.]
MMNPKEPNTVDRVQRIVDSDRGFFDRRIVFIVLTLIWTCLVGIGMSALWKYQGTPGEQTTSPRYWPVQSLLKHNQNGSTLIMFAHPHCPCTRASIGELSLLMTHCGEKIDARVLFFNSSKFSAGWKKTDLWYSAAEIPGVAVSSDQEGFEAKTFQSTTSGYVLLYDANGRLLFQGGITGSRGHSGENAGRSAIEAMLMNKTAETKQTFVYGCLLQDRTETSGKENQVCPQQ